MRPDPQLEDLKLFTLYCDGCTSLHSLALWAELAEGEGDLKVPQLMPHVELGPLEIAIHRWRGKTGSDAEVEDLGCPEMADVYAYLEAHPSLLCERSEQ